MTTQTEQLLNRKIDLRYTQTLSDNFRWGMNTYDSSQKEVPAHEALKMAMQMKSYAAELEAAAAKIFDAVEDYGLSAELKYHQDMMDGKGTGTLIDEDARIRTSGRIVELKGHLESLARGEYNPEAML